MFLTVIGNKGPASCLGKTELALAIWVGECGCEGLRAEVALLLPSTALGERAKAVVEGIAG